MSNKLKDVLSSLVSSAALLKHFACDFISNHAYISIFISNHAYISILISKLIEMCKHLSGEPGAFGIGSQK